MTHPRTSHWSSIQLHSTEEDDGTVTEQESPSAEMRMSTIKFPHKRRRSNSPPLEIERKNKRHHSDEEEEKMEVVQNDDTVIKLVSKS